MYVNGEYAIRVFSKLSCQQCLKDDSEPLRSPLGRSHRNAPGFNACPRAIAELDVPVKVSRAVFTYVAWLQLSGGIDGHCGNFNGDQTDL
eukprot:2206175-Amphidinium_carterae.1